MVAENYAKPVLTAKTDVYAERKSGKTKLVYDKETRTILRGPTMPDDPEQIMSLDGAAALKAELTAIRSQHRDLRWVLKLLIDDLADYPVSQRPCYALEQAQKVLALTAALPSPPPDKGSAIKAREVDNGR